MATLRQTSFSAGELAPLLWGRTDLPVFARGLRRCRNFFLSRHGAAVSRPGTLYVANFGLDAKVRLVPFVYSDSQSYVLALLGGRIDIFDSSGAFVTTVTSPYAAGDLAALKWAQTGNVMTLTHPSHEPQELRRLAHASWTLTTVSFDRPAPTLTAVEVSDSSGNALSGTALSGDSTHPAREWRWAITELRRDDRGVVYESKPFEAVTLKGGGTLPSRLPVYPDLAVRLTMSGQYAQMATDPNFLGYVVYRGRGGLYGLVGHTKDVTFTDVGDEPDYTIAPPQGRNPFKVYDASGVLLRTETPAAVAFFEERRVFACTAERPGWIFFSVTGDYSNFDERLVVTDDMAIELELASRRREEVRALVGHRRLLAFTNASVWSVGGSDGSPLTPDSVEAKVIDEVGAAVSLPPLVLDGAVLFSRAKGTGVRALVTDEPRGGYVPVDLSSTADHLFTGLSYISGAYAQTPLVDWAYQEDPWGLVWAAKGDGKLLSLTYLGPDMWGWAQHSFEGSVLSVCAIPNGDEDAVFLAATIGTLNGSAGNWTVLLKMTSRVRRGGTDDDICVDYAVKVEQAQPNKTLTHANLSVLQGHSVWVVSKNNPPFGPFAIGASNTIELPVAPAANNGTGWVGYVGLAYTPELETLDVAHSEARMRQKTVTRVGLEVDNSRGLHVGPDFDNLVEWRQRAVADGYAAVSAATEFVDIAVKAGWNQAARIAVRQTLPLPVTIVGLAREVDVGG